MNGDGTDLLQLKTQLENMEKLSKRVQDDMKAGWENVASSLQGMSEGINQTTSSLNGLADQNVNVMTSLLDVSKSGNGLADNLIQLGKGFGEASGAAQIAIPGVMAFGTAVDTAFSVISLVAAGINLVTQLVEQFGDDGSSAMKQLEETTDGLIAKTDELVSAASNTEISYLNAIELTKVEADKSSMLAKRFMELRDNAASSAAAQLRMGNVAERLVSLMPQLADEAGGYTKVLAMENDQLERAVDAQSALGVLYAMKERGIELDSQAREAKANYNALIAEECGIVEKLGTVQMRNGESLGTYLKKVKDQTVSTTEAWWAVQGLGGATEDAAEHFLELCDQEEAAADLMGESGKAYNEYERAISEYATSILDGYEQRIAAGEKLAEMDASELEMIGEMIGAGGEMSDNLVEDYQAIMEHQELMHAGLAAQLETYGAMIPTIEEYREAISGMTEAEIESYNNSLLVGAAIDDLKKKYEEAYISAYDSINGQIGLWQDIDNEAINSATNTAASLNNALASQIEYFGSYSNNMNDLLSRDIDGIEGLAAAFSDGSVESATALAGLVDASDEDVRAIIANMQGVDVIKGNLSETFAGVNVAYQSSADSTSDKAKAFCDGLVLEYDSMSGEIVTTMEGVGDKGVQAFDLHFFKPLDNKLDEAVDSVKNHMDSISDSVAEANTNLESITIKVNKPLLPVFGISGEFNAKTKSVPKVYISNWYDQGGYFDSPQVIGIAERRPEFVGAAQDLKTFISAAVADAFLVRANPALLHSVGGAAAGAGGYGGDTISFSPRVTINTQKLTDAEMKRATDFVSREFAKTVTGRKVGRLH